MKVISLQEITNRIRYKRSGRTLLGEFISQCKTEDAIIIPKGATREQVFEEVFGIGMMMAGSKSMEWWNAPYKKGDVKE